MTRESYLKALRVTWASNGLCPNCGARPPAPDRKLCSICLETARKVQKEFRKRNPKLFKHQYHALKKAGICTSCGTNPAEVGVQCSSCNLTERQRAVRIKYEVVQKYGGKCACCGENKVAFLSIDHINNDGGAKRKSGEHIAGGGFYKYLRRNEVDPTLQVLCYNCNFGRKITGVCPHEDNSYFEEALLKDKT